MLRKPGSDLRCAAPVFAALGDDRRLQIVARLCMDGPLSISRLTQGTRVTRQAVTKHLQVLERAGVLRGVRAGRERVWEVKSGSIEQARRYLDSISAQWDSALNRLKAFVEESVE